MSVRPIQRDEHVITVRDARILGVLGHISSCFTLAWLASHRHRLRTFLLGGKHLSILFIWDSKGAQNTDRSEADEKAIEQLTFGNTA